MPSYEDGTKLGMRFFSYWHQGAEAYTRKYIQRIQESLSYATCMPGIGHCGEYLFPPVHFYKFLGIHPSPWWCDDAATASWMDSGLSRKEWLCKELSRITKERLALYREKWLQFVPYYHAWDQCQFGNLGVQEVLEENREGLTTILFTVFPAMAAQQAQRYPTYGGAEGAQGILVNAPLAKQMGLKGLVCGPLFSQYASKMEPWMFSNIKQAVDILE
jgi:hypothetical protein